MKILLKIIISLSLIIGSFLFLQELFMPKYQSSIFEGNLTGDYYSSEKDNDIIFIGDCEVYENISPIAIWQSYGLKSYIRGNAQQLAWQSYYILEDTLKYETPKVVVYNVLALRHATPQNEAYNRMTLDDMPLSMTKINAVLSSMTEDESLIDYIFPLLRYHSRWNELTYEDLRYIFVDNSKTSHNGYLMNAGVKPVGVIPTPKALSNYDLPESSLTYLDKMRELCEQNGIEFVLMKTPSIYPTWYDEWNEQIDKYCEKYGLLYINCMEHMEDMGLDLTTDTYDSGLHLNILGAEKNGIYIAKVLTENFDLMSHFNDPKDKEIWDRKTDYYYEMLEQQLYELETYGYLKSFGGVAPEGGN